MFSKSPYKVELDSFTELRIETTNKLLSVKLEHQQEIYELDYQPTEFGYSADLSLIELELQAAIFVHLDDQFKQHVEIGMITTTAEFDHKFASDLELGAIYSEASTTFRVWSPVASTIILVLDNTEYIKMIGDGKHYQVTVAGDLVGHQYYYLVLIAGRYHKVIDPYALNSTLNTETGIIIDRNRYQYNQGYHANDKSTMVIYETSVCDFTSDINSDFKYPGKFIGFNQHQKIEDRTIGIDYVKELGVTHLQLMPIYDFGSVNEQLLADNNYNWGYDPVHYNIPEGSYVVGTKFDSRIIECQQMIQGIKANGIGVIMDVVYNHVYDPTTFNYNLLVPNYYFRFKPNREYSNGAFCGNEVASERSMVRRYIIDTLQTWVTIYGIDGIRIDYMSLIDIETIKQIEAAMTVINPNFIIYGEGWNNEGMLDVTKRASQINANQLPNVGHFNDDLRNFIKGNNEDLTQIGYVQGNTDETTLIRILCGNPLDSEKKYVNHYQLINYLSCHDDHTLYDYLKFNEQSEEQLTSQIIKAYELLFAAKGIVFIHSGCEFKRTKYGLKNTYNCPRQLNAIKWRQRLENEEIIKIIKDLIKRRKNAKYE